VNELHSKMTDGSTKPVEEVKQGDLVASRDEKTGETVSKRVVEA
jgi:hypothetical protein